MKPYIILDNAPDFELKEAILRKHPNDFISLYLYWSPGPRMLEQDYSTSDGRSVGVGLKYGAFAIEAGIVADYDYLFFRNLKYAVEIWFAPRNWENYDESKIIYDKIPPLKGE